MHLPGVVALSKLMNMSLNGPFFKALLPWLCCQGTVSSERAATGANNRSGRVLAAPPDGQVGTRITDLTLPPHARTYMSTVYRELKYATLTWPITYVGKVESTHDKAFAWCVLRM